MTGVQTCALPISMYYKDNISISTDILLAVTDNLKQENIEDPEIAMAIISRYISEVRQKGEDLLQQTRVWTFLSEDTRKHLQDEIGRSIVMIENRLNKLHNDYVEHNQPVPSNIGIVIPMRLDAIQQRLRIFQENQNNTVEFNQMEAEAIQLLEELNQIQRRLPPLGAVGDHNKIKEVRGLNWRIDQLKNSLTHFIKLFGDLSAAKIPVYEALVAAALNPITGRRENLSFEERVASLSDISGRGTKKEPGARYFEGGKRKTRKRRRKTRKRKRKRKKKTKHKPKKKHRRTKRG